MASSETPQSSSSRETPFINNSTKTKTMFSVRSSVSNFKAKFCISRPKSLENSHHNAASSIQTTNKNDDDRHDTSDSSSEITKDNDDGEEDLHRLSEMIDEVDLALKDYTDRMNVQINLARDKLEKLKKLKKLQTSASSGRDDFEELQMAIPMLKVQTSLPSSEIVSNPPTETERLREFYQLQKAIKKLKLRIPSHVKIRSAHSYRHPYDWPNINGAKDGMMDFFYKEAQVTHNMDYRWLEAFHELPKVLQIRLLCFFKFPPEATIKRSTMIYLWIALGAWRVANEDHGNMTFDKLVQLGFIQPVFQNCSLMPDSCRMSLQVRSALLKEAEFHGFTSNDNLALDDRFLRGPLCLVNVGEPIVDREPESFVAKVDHITCLYLGRWQRSATTHHIELTDPKIFNGLKKMKNLTFLSLQGISMITELPISLLELNCLEILDLRACYNLEAIPDNIGLLESLTHLDMSECYFLEHMPKSLAQLSNLEVLKGFLIGDFNKSKQSCTLSDLSRLQKLRKLNIYVSVKDVDRLWDFNDLENFGVLQKLRISWGGCSLHGESRSKSQGKASTKKLSPARIKLPPKLQKLDLHGFPSKALIDFLGPSKEMELKKLYLRGGQLCDLGQSTDWNVQILRLKYLRELDIDWSELMRVFPKLIYLHQVGCPKLSNCRCDESGVWKDVNHEYIQEQVQKYSEVQTHGIDSS